MAYSNIDIQKFLVDKSNASMTATEKKCSDASMTTIEKKCSNSLLLDMLAEGLNADITFQVKGGTVKAHRSVLAMVLPVFRKMFQWETKELVLPLPLLHDITIESLQLFLVLLYNTNEKSRAMPKFNIAVDKHFIALFDAAYKFQVEGRLNVVLKSGLLRHLTPNNCWKFYYKHQEITQYLKHESDYYDFFHDAWMSYIMKNFEMVTGSPYMWNLERNPELSWLVFNEAKSQGLWCESCRQKTTRKRKLKAKCSNS